MTDRHAGDGTTGMAGTAGMADSVSSPDIAGTESAELFCRLDGRIEAIYTEAIDLTRLGPATIRRASHVEPDAAGRWWADLSPSGGSRLGPFACRSAALAAERHWLLRRLDACGVRIAD